MPIKRKTIKINGREIEVDAYDTRLIPGSGKEEEAIESLYREDKIEEEIQKAIKKIDAMATEYKGEKRDIWYYYKVGKILQFVDDNEFLDVKGSIWERMADNLRPELFTGSKRPPKKAKTYPERMYLLAKQNREDIERVTWSHWFEILQYPKIYKNQKVVAQLLKECEKKRLSSGELRKRIQEVKKQV